MKGLFIFLFFFFIIVGGIGVLVYYFYEKPIINEMQNASTCNLNIDALDSMGNKVKTGYSINSYLNIKEGETEDNAFVKERILVNSSITIFNKNLGDQHYYTSFKQINSCINSGETIRVDLELIPFGEVKVNYTGSLSDTNFTINISVKGLLRSPLMCISWPANIITINPTETLSEEAVPARLDGTGIDKCYNLGEDIKDSDKLITFEFDKFGNLFPNDFLKIYLVDEDYRFVNGAMILVNGYEDYNLIVIV